MRQCQPEPVTIVERPKTMLQMLLHEALAGSKLALEMLRSLSSYASPFRGTRWWR